MKNSKLVISVLLLFFSFSIWAKEISVSSASYDEALKKESFIKFDMKSTKAGIITTGFTGVAKKFSFTYEETSQTLTKMTVLIPAKDLDTDSDGRNEKMWEFCLMASKNPDIKVDIAGPVVLKEGNVDVDGFIQVRGLFYPVKLKLEIKKKEAGFSVKGTSNLTISELKIPDPSIFIAKVRDLIELNFSISL